MITINVTNAAVLAVAIVTCCACIFAGTKSDHAGFIVAGLVSAAVMCVSFVLMIFRLV